MTECQGCAQGWPLKDGQHIRVPKHDGDTGYYVPCTRPTGHQASMGGVTMQTFPDSESPTDGKERRMVHCVKCKGKPPKGTCADGCVWVGGFQPDPSAGREPACQHTGSTYGVAGGMKCADCGVVIRGDHPTPVGSAAEANLSKTISGALYECIRVHGPITKEFLASATKRVAGEMTTALSAARETGRTELRGELTEVIAKADCYDRVCQSLGVTSNLLGRVEELKTAEFRKGLRRGAEQVMNEFLASCEVAESEAIVKHIKGVIGTMRQEAGNGA